MTVRSTLTRWRDGLAVRFPRTTVRVREWTLRTWATQAPRDRAWRGAAVGLFVATLVVVADAILQRAMLPLPTLDRLADIGWDLGAAALAGIGLVVLVAVVSRMPWRYRLTLGVCGAVLAGRFPFSADAGVLIWGIVAFSAAGAGLATISRENIGEITRLQRGLATVGIVVGLGSVGFLLYWLGSSGDDALEYRNAAVEAAGDDGPAEPDHVMLADPSRAGAYEVRTLTYGTGEDRRRLEFGRDADLITATVDGRPFLNEWTGDRGSERKDFWGFDRDELPLQGRVWYPDGDGPFPLVLIVHGNHSMYEYSDPGYGYLGELLASRGYILVSVDENFINGSIRQENDARAWLLLEHLAVWRRWSRGETATEQHPFVGKVDMGRIGLIGHSRGGEAVAVAAAFNTLPYYPDDATVGFDYGFDIGAVIAIAPIMGQYSAQWARQRSARRQLLRHPRRERRRRSFVRRRRPVRARVVFRRRLPVQVVALRDGGQSWPVQPGLGRSRFWAALWPPVEHAAAHARGRPAPDRGGLYQRVPRGHPAGRAGLPAAVRGRPCRRRVVARDRVSAGVRRRAVNPHRDLRRGRRRHDHDHRRWAHGGRASDGVAGAAGLDEIGRQEDHRRLSGLEGRRGRRGR